ncbi:MAG: hypothetical protein E4H45_00380 [Nitrospirales bacterium]|nr:MAG: hypothetical protein E4H45_00380 [Nitrospirales bacterium]
MMMRFGFILLFIALIADSASAGEDKERYIIENRLLKEELALARKPNIYFVFNLREKMTYINSRSIHLRELRIKDCHYWGSPASVTAYRLRKKNTLIEPSREIIKPGENKDGFKLDALELADMPSRYTLFFDGGLKISIRPETEGVFSGICNFFYSSKRFLARPVITLWNTLWDKPYTAIDIVLDKNDAMALYWSISEGSGAIVYAPST